MGTDAMKLPDLEQPCERCDGTGETRDRNCVEDCPLCCGAGRVPTDFGDRVLALIRHNLKGHVEWRN